jgi:hypothetical protein
MENILIWFLQRWLLKKGDWSASHPCRFTPGERAPSTHWIGGWVGPRAGLDDTEKWKFFTLLGLELRSPGRSARSQSLYRSGCDLSEVINPDSARRNWGKWRNKSCHCLLVWVCSSSSRQTERWQHCRVQDPLWTQDVCLSVQWARLQSNQARYSGQSACLHACYSLGCTDRCRSSVAGLEHLRLATTIPQPLRHTVLQ